MNTSNLEANQEIENRVNSLFSSLRPAPWFKSGEKGLGPEDYDRSDDAYFQDHVEQEYGLFNFDHSEVEIPYDKLEEAEEE